MCGGYREAPVPVERRPLRPPTVSLNPAAEAAAAPREVVNRRSCKWPRDTPQVPVGDDTYAYRRRLPHLVKRDRTYYVTFCTYGRQILPPPARTLTLASCIHDHGTLCWMDCVVVMHDHVHLVVQPHESATLARILDRIKGASAHRVNRLFRRTGSIWQRESFDRMVRSEESLRKKREYVFANPVRAGLVGRAEEYPWVWFAR